MWNHYKSCYWTAILPGTKICCVEDSEAILNLPQWTSFFLSIPRACHDPAQMKIVGEGSRGQTGHLQPRQDPVILTKTNRILFLIYSCILQDLNQSGRDRLFRRRSIHVEEWFENLILRMFFIGGNCLSSWLTLY